MVFLVTTPELPSLRLAHERIVQLAAENLGDRVELIVNRAGSIGREQIEDLLSYPVYFEFRNDYQAVNAALRGASPWVQWRGSSAGLPPRFPVIRQAGTSRRQASGVSCSTA